MVSDRTGSILPMFAVVVTVVFMVAAVAVDFARYALASEKLQTAGDAAATAASVTAKRYVRVQIDTGRYWTKCCSMDKDGNKKCRPCCKKCDKGTVIKEGREDELIDKKGYKKYCCNCGCGKVRILDRWVEYEKGGAEAASAAELFFNLNKPKEMDEENGGDSYIKSIRVVNDRDDPLYPSVIVKTEGRVKTLMMDFMDKIWGADLSELSTTRCSQGGSFYYDFNGKWHRAAEEGCY
ncbi:MAG: pilus assembly protein TadG-related protein [Bacillota bacterium]